MLSKCMVWPIPYAPIYWTGASTNGPSGLFSGTLSKAFLYEYAEGRTVTGHRLQYQIANDTDLAWFFRRH